MSKILASLALATCLITPSARIYAQEHHDHQAHVWNDGEKDYWHRFLKETRKKDHEWAKANKREQAAYWKWRDEHHDR